MVDNKTTWTPFAIPRPEGKIRPQKCKKVARRFSDLVGNLNDP